MGAVKELYIQEQNRVSELTQDNKAVIVKAEMVEHRELAFSAFAEVAGINVVVWFSKSQVVNPDPITLNRARLGDSLTLTIPLWIVKKKRLSYTERR